MTTVLSRVWQAWRRAAQWLGDKQAIVVYTVLYFLVIGPIALGRRLFTDPLQLRARGRLTFWLPRAAMPATLDEARRQ